MPDQDKDIIAGAAGRAWAKQAETAALPAPAKLPTISLNNGVYNAPTASPPPAPIKVPAVPGQNMFDQVGRLQHGTGRWLNRMYTPGAVSAGRYEPTTGKLYNDQFARGNAHELIQQHVAQNNATPAYQQSLAQRFQTLGQNPREAYSLQKVPVAAGDTKPDMVNETPRDIVKKHMTLSQPVPPSGQPIAPPIPEAAQKNLQAIDNMDPNLTGLHELEHVNQQGYKVPTQYELPTRTNLISGQRSLGNEEIETSGGLPLPQYQAEPAAVMAELVHGADAARTATGSPVPGNVALTPQYQPKLDWLRQQAQQHGVLSGEHTAQEQLNTPAGQAWLRMQYDQLAPPQGVLYNKYMQENARKLQRSFQDAKELGGTLPNLPEYMQQDLPKYLTKQNSAFAAAAGKAWAKQAVASQEDIFDAVRPLIPGKPLLASGGLPDVSGVSDVDVGLHTQDYKNLLAQLPKGTTAKHAPTHSYYSIPGYAREINIFATPDEVLAHRAANHRAIQLQLRDKFPELTALARKYKAEGLGTEPAWAKVIGLKGDPYEGMLDNKKVLAAAGKAWAKSAKTFYHGSPNADLQTLAPGSYVTPDLDTAKLMGRFHADTGKTWSDDDLAEKHKFGEQPKWKPGREPAGEPAVYKLQAALKQLNLLDNPYEHTTLESLPVEKQADLLPGVQLQDHQQRIADEVSGVNPRMLVYHGLGSGKSLSALAAAEAAQKMYGGNYGIVAPASLRGNFQKEVKKFTTSKPEIMSYTGLGMGKQFKDQPETLIMDEAARLRNPNAASTRAAFQAAQKADRLMLLTGTPITNEPKDLASIVSMLNKQQITPDQFEKEYVGYKKVWPGLWGWLHGAKSGEKPIIRNGPELRRLLEGKVDYQASKTPEGVNVNEQTIRVPLSPEQQRIQKAVRTKVPPGFLWKMDKEFPLSRQELGKLNSFMTGLRQVSLSTQPFRADRDPLKAFQQSAKMQEAFKNLKGTLDSDPRKKAIIYSNFVDAGLGPYAAGLTQAGVPHAFFHGGISAKARQAAVDNYNSGKLRALLIGPAGAEGISTKGTNLIQLMDPHWNEARTQQAQGRGLRFDSHAGLPEELKNVAVQRYLSSSQDPSMLGKLMGYKRERTGDEVLERLTAEKEKLNEEFRNLLRDVGSQHKQNPAQIAEKVGASFARRIYSAPTV